MERAPERAEMRRLTAGQTEWVVTRLSLKYMAAKLSVAQIRLARTADWLETDECWLGWKACATGTVELAETLETTAAVTVWVWA